MDPLYCKYYSLELIVQWTLTCYGRSIDEAEYLLDQVPPPEADEEPMVTRLREKLRELLTELRKGAEGNN